MTFLLGSSGFTTLTPNRLWSGGTTTVNQTYTVDFANYTAGASTITLMDFGVNSYTTLNATSFQSSTFNYLNLPGNLAASMSWNNSTLAIQLAISKVALTWAGGSGNWTTGFSSNPTNGDMIAFTGAGGTATNNISSATLTTLDEIEFRSGAGAYTLTADAGAAGASGGTALTINGSIINNSTNTQTINMDLAFAATRSIDTNTGNITIGGVVSGAGGLTKNGSSTLTLSNSNTYNGATTINAGTLQIDGNIANSGLVINSGATISPGSTAAADSFATSSITINGGGYNWTLNTANGTAGSGWDQITSTGALTSSGLMTIYAYGTPGDWDNAASYSWDIINANSVSGFSASNFALDLSNFGIAAGNRTGTWSFSNPSGGIIRLSYAASGDPVWTGGSANWSTGFTPAVTEGNTIAFSGAGGTATNNISSATLTTVNNIEFRSGAGAYTLAANAGSAGASGGTALTVNGSIINSSLDTQTINIDMAFAATRTIAANAGNIAIGGAISGAGGLTKNGTNPLTLSGNNTYTGATTINAGTLQIGTGSTSGALSASSAITNNANLVFNRSNDLSVANTITGSGNLTQAGAGTLTLSGASSSYTGTTTISAGTIQIGHANGLGSGGNITFDGGGLKYGSGITTDLSSRIKNSGSAILVDTNGQSVTWATNLGTTNTGGLTKDGTGTLTLTAANTFSGGTTVNGGTLTLTAANTYSGGTTVNGGTLQIGNRTNANAAVLGTTTLSGGNLSYDYNAANFAVNGAITLTSEATITKLNGAYQINFGSGTLNGGGQTLNIYVDTVAGTKPLYFNQTAGTSLGQINILNGAAAQDGSGGTPLRNATMNISNGAQFQTWSSPTINNNITLNGGAGPDGNGALYNASSNSGHSPTYTGTITLADATNSSIGSNAGGITISGQITGGGSLTKISSRTLTLSGNNTYSGDTTINAGTIEIGAAGRLGAGSYAGNISNNGTFIYSGTNAQTLSGILSGTGALTKNASSTLTLTNASNDYSGGTTLNTGTLVIGNAAAAGTGTITQADGTSVLKLDTTGTIANAMSIYNVASNKTVTLSGAITAQNTTYDVASGTTLSINGSISGTGGVTKDGAGTLELNAANTFTGETVVNAGTLEANATGSLGSTTNITVNGGSLLVGANNAINDSAAMDLAGGTLEFNGNINETVGALTLSANSVIDMGGGNISLEFSNLVTQLTSTTQLKIYNYTLYSDHLYFTSNANVSDSLQYISFYSDFGSSFIGNSFISSFSSPWQVQPVPEPETWATAALLALGGVWLLRRKKQSA